ncbi:hypothetical protein [Flavobacterium sp. JP2137]
MITMHQGVLSAYRYGPGFDRSIDGLLAERDLGYTQLKPSA